MPSRNDNKQEKKHKRLILCTIGGVVALVLVFIIYQYQHQSKNSSKKENLVNSSIGSIPENENKVVLVFANENQYSKGGYAACSCIAITYLKKLLREEFALPNTNNLDKVVEEGIASYKESFPGDHENNMAPSFVDDVVAKLLPKDYKSSDTTMFGYSESLNVEALRKHLEQAGKIKQFGYFINGTETLAIESYGDNTFSIFDSHGKSADMNKFALAYWKKFGIEELIAFIKEYNPDTFIVGNELLAHNQQASTMNITWITQLKQ